ncbi:MAG TPA: acetyl-CoA carboxylase biotin carboxyl carrier protein [Candidatus Acidoferrales bacterium]|nr:acetyl-CoA carboxylase biotin carboxyl carrier protein [Candidatus Acidoferrales bacterium]
MKGKKKPGSPAGPAKPDVDLGQVERVLAFMAEHGLEEFEYARGDLHIWLKKPSANSNPAAARSLATPEIISAPAGGSGEPGEGGAPSHEGLAAPSPAEDFHTVKSPIVGTFYAAPSPDAQPFVKLGDTVKPGQVLCIIEAMKLMNEIEAEVGGEVMRIFAENGQPVEYGEALFAIRPTGKK